MSRHLPDPNRNPTAREVQRWPSTSRGPPAGCVAGNMKGVRSRFKVNRARGQEPFERMGDTGFHALPMFAGRSGRASQPSAFPRGKAPRAWNLARGVSDDLGGALSSAGLDPSVRTLGRPRPRSPAGMQRVGLAAARTSWQLQAQFLETISKFARDLSAPSFRCRRMIGTRCVQLRPNCLRGSIAEGVA